MKLALMAALAAPLYATNFFTTPNPAFGTVPPPCPRPGGTLSVPRWCYMVTGWDGQTYFGVIAGRSPAVGGTTTINVPIIPIILTAGGRVFDPTQPDPVCLPPGQSAVSMTLASPIFQPVPTTYNGTFVGNVQFLDGFNRAQFWNWQGVGGSHPSYHLILNPIVKPPLVLVGDSTNSDARPANNTQCGTIGTQYLGLIDLQTIDSAMQAYLAADPTINASMFPMFMLYNSAITIGNPAQGGNCCVLGYHGALNSPGQTYGVSSYEGRQLTLFGGISDISILTHEFAEFLDDPFGGNATPYWGGIGQLAGCSPQLEVADPLTGRLNPPITVNGYNYHTQEIAYFDWFFGTSVSLGYSTNGTFTGHSKACPPGGSQ